MMIKLKEIISRIGCETVFAGAPVRDNDIIDCVVTDSRLFKEKGDFSRAVFVALKGEKFDANDFISDAAEARVRLIICGDRAKAEKSRLNDRVTVVFCEDTLKAYGATAGIKRELMTKTRFTAVTGSVGKTTAKEFVSAALSSIGVTVKTPANHNNEIGVPRTLLEMTGEEDFAVTEMGMRGRGQIDYLASIVRPEVGIVTNVGTAHIELLGTLENTRLAKLEIADYMDGHSRLVVNGDNDMLEPETVRKILLANAENSGKDASDVPEVLAFGQSENCYFKANKINVSLQGTSFELTVGDGFSAEVRLPVIGEHYVYGALAGIAAAFCMGADGVTLREKVIPALESIGPSDIGRQQVFKTRGITVIDDCYNASPEAVKVELGVLEKLSRGGRKVAFLGDMLELGRASEDEHIKVGAECAEKGVDVCVCVGPLSENMEKGAAFGSATRFVKVKDSEEASKLIGEILRPGDTVLVKGSHSMKMSVIVDAIRMPGQ